MTGGLSYVFEGEALTPVRGLGEDVVADYLVMDLRVRPATVKEALPPRPAGCRKAARSPISPT